MWEWWIFLTTWLFVNFDHIILGLFVVLLNVFICAGGEFTYIILLYLSLIVFWQFLFLSRPFRYWLGVVMIIDLVVMLLASFVVLHKPTLEKFTQCFNWFWQGQRKIDLLNMRAGLCIFLLNESVVACVKLYINLFTPAWHKLIWEHIYFHVLQETLFYDLVPFDPFFWAHIWHLLPLILIPLYYTFFSYNTMCDLCAEYDFLPTWAEAKQATQQVVGVFAVLYWVYSGLPPSIVLFVLVVWAKHY